MTLQNIWKAYNAPGYWVSKWNFNHLRENVGITSAGWFMETWGQQLTRTTRNHEEQNTNVPLEQRCSLSWQQRVCRPWLGFLMPLHSWWVMFSFYHDSFYNPPSGNPGQFFSSLNTQIPPRSALSPPSTLSAKMNLVPSPRTRWSVWSSILFSMCSSYRIFSFLFSRAFSSFNKFHPFQCKSIAFKTIISDLNFKAYFKNIKKQNIKLFLSLHFCNNSLILFKETDTSC